MLQEAKGWDAYWSNHYDLAQNCPLSLAVRWKWLYATVPIVTTVNSYIHSCMGSQLGKVLNPVHCNRNRVNPLQGNHNTYLSATFVMHMHYNMYVAICIYMIYVATTYVYDT